MSASEKQLRLFPAPKPLLDRLGNEFFRSAPVSPGVYRMYDEGGRLIYVGQSKNLRQRLASYKNAQPERVSRKVVRLIHSAARIEWEVCSDVRAARLLENFLLREHRPKFNTVNTYPRAYLFIGFAASDGSLRLRLTREFSSEDQLFGAFKTGAIMAYGALVRLLWSMRHQPRSLAEFPCGFLGTALPRNWELDMLEGGALEKWGAGVAAYLEGSSAEVLEGFAKQAAEWRGLVPFHSQLIASDLETLTQFFGSGPQRNLGLRQRHGLTSTWIPPETLDDWLVEGF